VGKELKKMVDGKIKSYKQCEYCSGFQAVLTKPMEVMRMQELIKHIAQSLVDIPTKWK